ncbi:unnamed protein product, partial [Prorocentrum cordatum]
SFSAPPPSQTSPLGCSRRALALHLPPPKKKVQADRPTDSPRLDRPLIMESAHQLNSGLGCPRAPAGGLVVHCGAGAVLRPCSGLAVRRRLAWAAGSPQREARAGRLMRAGRREGGGRGQEAGKSAEGGRKRGGAAELLLKRAGARPPWRGRLPRARARRGRAPAGAWPAGKKKTAERRQASEQQRWPLLRTVRSPLRVFAAVKWYDMGRNPPNHRLTRTSGHRRSGAHSAPRRRGVEVTRGAVSFLPPSLAPTVRGGYREGGRETYKWDRQRTSKKRTETEGAHTRRAPTRDANGNPLLKEQSVV